MAMDQEGNRREDDDGLDDPSDGGWYFDLPSGAWERQEAKNRELRQSVRRNIKETAHDDGRTAFRPRSHPFEDAETGRSEQRAGWQPRQEADETAARAGEFTTAPEEVVSRPLLGSALTRRGNAGNQEADNPLGGGSVGAFDWSTEPAVPPRRRLLRLSSAEIEAAERAREDAIYATRHPGSGQAPQHGAREPLAGEDAGGTLVRGMRGWAAGGAAPSPDSPDARGEDERTSSRAPRWDEAFSAPADASGILESMRDWASQPEPTPSEDESTPTSLDELPPELLQPFDWEQDQPAPSREAETVEEVPTVEGIASAEGSDWANEEQPLPSAKAEPSGTSFPAGAPEMDSWSHLSPSAEEAPTEMKAAPRSGLFGRLFGRKQKREEAAQEAVPWSGDWVADEPDPASFWRNEGGAALPDASPIAEVATPETDWEEPEEALADTAPWAWVSAANAEVEPTAAVETAEADWQEPDEASGENAPWAWPPAAAQIEVGPTAEVEPAKADWQSFAEEPEEAPAVTTPWAWTPATTQIDMHPAAEVETAEADWRALAEEQDEASAETTPWAWAPAAAQAEVEPTPAVETAEADWRALAEEPDEAPVESAPWAWPPTAAQADMEPTAGVEGPEADSHALAEEQDMEAEPATESRVEWPTAAAQLSWSSPAVPREPLSEAHNASPPGQPDPDEMMASVDADSEESTDDPWAAFIAARRESDGPVPFASPVAANPGAASHWTTNVAPVDEDHADGDGGGSDDDPWSAVAAASGYDAGATDVGVYRGRQYRSGADVPASSPLSPEAAESEEPPAAEQPLRARGEGTASSPPSDATWDFANDQDIVLRAFEAHALSDMDNASGRKERPEEQDGGFSELLGRDAADLVDEVSEQRNVGFLTSRGLAAQQSPSGEGSLTWMPPTPPPGARPGSAEHEGWGDDEDDQLPPWDTGNGSDGPGDDAETVAGDRSRGRTLVRELVETGLLALLVFLAVRASFQNFKVDGLSMSPTLQNGQFLIVNKLVYSQVDLEKLSRYLPFIDPGDTPKRDVFHGPDRGDIVVLKDPKRPDTDLIKRVVGLPGETLEIVQGKVYINGRYLEEPYIKTPWHFDKPKQVIPPGEYFVMGDNRDNSLDSRSPQVGLVPREMIIGKAMLSYWPLSEFGLAPNATPKLEEKPTLTTLRLDPATAR